MQVTVIGAGTVGLSWTGLFLANGAKVTICDPRPDIRLWALSGLEGIKWSLVSLGYSIDKFTRQLCFEDKLHKAVQDADIIQECIPEELEAKRSMYEKLERFAPSSALMLSSSAGFSASEMAVRMTNAGRMMVGHSFCPPHLIPLVEVGPGERTSPESIRKAMDFYRRMGKYPVLIGKEVAGLVANRLHFALLREGIHLVTSGVITIESLDEIVRSSLGPRWAAAGPFKTIALGGAGGLGNFLEQLGPTVEHIWRGLGHVKLDAETRASLRKQSDDVYARVPVEDLVKERDEHQIAILRALRKQP